MAQENGPKFAGVCGDVVDHRPGLVAMLAGRCRVATFHFKLGQRGQDLPKNNQLVPRLIDQGTKSLRVLQRRVGVVDGARSHDSDEPPRVPRVEDAANRPTAIPP